jgi:hypothetical protein
MLYVKHGCLNLVRWPSLPETTTQGIGLPSLPSPAISGKLQIRKIYDWREAREHINVIFSMFA